MYLITGYTDMRLFINRLMPIIRDVYKMNPYANNLYLFYGRSSERKKALANIRSQKIMDRFEKLDESIGLKLKIRADFGKDGERPSMGF